MSDLVSIYKEIEWDAGHRVPGHQSKCRHPHGHRYKLRVTCAGHIVETPGAPDEGMLVDFGDLKKIMTERVHDVLDHGFIVYQGDDTLMSLFTNPWSRAADDTPWVDDWNIIVFPKVPTAENIAIWIWDQLESPIRDRFGEHLWLEEVKVWETPTSVAIFSGIGRSST